VESMTILEKRQNRGMQTLRIILGKCIIMAIE
jgi:hypothetical protein